MPRKQTASAKPVTILHLSDLHFGFASDDATAVAQRETALSGLIAELAKLDAEWQPDILAISGDLSWQGKKAGYSALAKWLTQNLYKYRRGSKLSARTTVICPGNHDLVRAKANSLQGHTTDFKRADEVLHPASLNDGFARPFAGFIDFASVLKIPAPKLYGKASYLSGIRELHGLKFLCLNSAWFCRGDQDRGKLWLGQPQLDLMDEALLKPASEYNSAALTIALIHHPPDWLADAENNSYDNRPATYNLIADRCHIILSGHTHGTVVKPNRMYDRARLFRAGATYETTRHYRNNFSLLRIDPQARSVTHRPWELDPSKPAWEEKSGHSYSLDLEGPARRYKDPSRYLSWLRTETRHIELHQLQLGPEKIPPPSIDALYIRLRCHTGMRPDLARKSKSLAPDAAIAGTQELQDILQGHQRLVIEGQPGGGKTTFLRWLAWNLCRPEGSPAGFPIQGFPLFVRISQLDTHIQNTLDHPLAGDPSEFEDPRWIAHFLARRGWKLDEAWFTEKLDDPGTVLLLDGLDEAASQSRRELIVKLFERAAAAFDCRLIVTTRPGAHEGRTTLKGFDKATIEELDTAGVEGFLRQWCRWLKQGDETEAETYLKELLPAVQVPGIRPLARNPLMLTALAALYLRRHRLPEQRAQLYEQILDWLAEQTVDKHRGKWRKDYLLNQFGALALAMQQWKGGQKLQLGIDTAAHTLAPDGRDIAQVRAFLENAQVDSGIVTLRGGTELAFWHRSFQEYLCARVLADLPDSKLGPAACGFLYKPEGREVLPLMAGCMAARAGDRLTLLFDALIAHASQQVKLEEKAHAVGVLGNMLSDIAVTTYSLPDATTRTYAKLREPVMAIFEKGGATGLGIKTRVAAAEALDQASQSRLPRPFEERYWVEIKSGTLTTGDDKKAINYLPAGKHKIPGFRIGRFPVTVFEFAGFLADTQSEGPKDWNDQSKHPSRPVTSISWHDANAYCAWVSEKWRLKCRLATELEWEFAARGEAGRFYAWGNEAPDESRANFADKVGHPSPVGMFPDGDTPEPESLSDLTGNVWEWTSSDYGKKQKVLRGAGFVSGGGVLRATVRDWNGPVLRDSDVGFRCVRE